MQKQFKFGMTVLCLSFAAASFGAYADDTSTGESKATIKEVAPDQLNKTNGSDVDELITNNLLRAQSGSKSKYSIASSLSYYGGSLNEPLGEGRPNITAGNGNTAVAQMVGDVSVKYNFDQLHSLMLGTGVRWITPLYGRSAPAGYQKTDADNPYMTYQYVYKTYGLQNVFQASPMIYTQANQKQQGYASSMTLQQTTIKEIGHSGLSVGASAAVQGNTFNKTGGIDPSSGAAKATYASEQTDYSLQLYPFVEYQLTDKVNLRTLLGAQFEHTRDLASATEFQRDKVYQSLGVGISVTRDIFLYPNVQFIPDQLRAKDTNVGMSANINVF